MIPTFFQELFKLIWVTTIVVFLILNKPISKSKHINENVLRRDKSNFNSDLFRWDLESNLHYLNADFFNATSNSFDKLFADFIAVIQNTVEQHAPLKKISRKQCMLQAKPWITKGSAKSIQQKRSRYNRVLHFLANIDFQLAWAIFRVETRQLSLLQYIFWFFGFLSSTPRLKFWDSRAPPDNCKLL